MIIVIIVLLIILALCSIWETSFSGLNLIRIKHLAENKNKKAIKVYKLGTKYSETLTTVLIINCVCSVFTSSLAASYFSNIYGDDYLGLITIILTIIILIFTEIIPKILGREYSEKYALKFCDILNVFVIILKPITKIINIFERKIKNNHKITATKEELVEIVKTIQDEGVINREESSFIQNVVMIEKMKVQNVMIPKDNVSYLYDTASSFKVKECIFRDNHDRIPIINKNNKIMGILYEVDLLDELLDNGTVSIKNSMKEPICVSMNTPLDVCLELLHEARAHMAIVSDYKNNFLGIVTLEDIISELMKA